MSLGVERLQDEENGRHRRALSSGDLTALLEVSPPDRRLVYLTAATTGLRRGELGKLQWSDLDLGPAPGLQLDPAPQAPGAS